MSILLIRHGETALNAARVVQPPDTPLSERGIAQADRLGRRLAERAVSLILSSDHARASMTAERLKLATGADVDIDPGLRERDFGDIRGTPYAELQVDLFGPDYEPPRGESWSVFHARVDEVWERVIAHADGLEGDLAVVTHGLVCASITARKLALPHGLGQAPAHWANTSLTIVEAKAPWAVKLLACTAHLDGAVADDAEAVSGL